MKKQKQEAALRHLKDQLILKLNLRVEISID